MTDEPLTREAVTAEVSKAMTDPNHPQHQNYLRNHAAYGEWSDGLYRRIVPEAQTQASLLRSDEIAPPPADAGDSVDTAFRQSVLTSVKERGIDATSVGTEAVRLFAGKDGAALLDVLEAPLLGLAPQAEVQAHVAMASYLGDLHKLRSSALSGDAPAGDFEASLDAVLRSRGYAREHLVELENQLFAGKPAAYAHFVKYLDGMPDRVAAYVRSAEALMMLQSLYQSRS